MKKIIITAAAVVLGLWAMPTMAEHHHYGGWGEHRGWGGDGEGEGLGIAAGILGAEIVGEELSEPRRERVSSYEICRERVADGEFDGYGLSHNEKMRECLG